MGTATSTLVVTNVNSGLLSILMGKGMGRVMEHRHSRRRRCLPVSLVLTDFNNDGKLDDRGRNRHAGLHRAESGKLLPWTCCSATGMERSKAPRCFPPARVHADFAGDHQI